MQYVQTARAKGLPERVVIYKHAVRNAPASPNYESGHEPAWHHLRLHSRLHRLEPADCGPLYFNALRSQDMFLAGTFLVFMAIMLVIGNFLADIALALVDPRIRYE